MSDAIFSSAGASASIFSDLATYGRESNSSCKDIELKSRINGSSAKSTDDFSRPVGRGGDDIILIPNENERGPPADAIITAAGELPSRTDVSRV